ncbi:HAD family hydrolase [Pedobacter sp. SYP-B3415]|uniref:HAD family hydrolase n=1 Tax=Pedobacter sp. SYP-B3415 TaxID=2496641 RepID=UPI00101D20A7|nr:HAD family hydrolase [Pedobacter sp. SYP-B3415]
MQKTIFFIDLDNTVYFTAPHTQQLLGELYDFLDGQELGISPDQLESARKEMLHTPFQRVAEKYGFDREEAAKTVSFLQQGEVRAPLAVHEEYIYLKQLHGRKFIVTAGFTRKQQSKVIMLGIKDDFEDVYVVDVSIKPETKKDAFLALITRHELDPSRILVIGDDAESEIRAGLDLGLETFLFDPDGRYPDSPTTYRGASLKDIGAAAGQ